MITICSFYNVSGRPSTFNFSYSWKFKQNFLVSVFGHHASQMHSSIGNRVSIFNQIRVLSFPTPLLSSLHLKLLTESFFNYSSGSSFCRYNPIFHCPVGVLYFQGSTFCIVHFKREILIYPRPLNVQIEDSTSMAHQLSSVQILFGASTHLSAFIVQLESSTFSFQPSHCPRKERRNHAISFSDVPSNRRALRSQSFTLSSKEWNIDPILKKRKKKQSHFGFFTGHCSKVTKYFLEGDLFMHSFLNYTFECP
jgi:hypothetical protein